MAFLSHLRFVNVRINVFECKPDVRWGHAPVLIGGKGLEVDLDDQY